MSEAVFSDFPLQFGAYFTLILGLSMLINNRKWVFLVKKVVESSEKPQGSTILFIATFLFVPLGLFILLIHNKWSFAPSILITLLGWGLFLKGVLFSVLPSSSLVMRWFKKLPEKYLLLEFQIFGALCSLLALWTILDFYLFI